MDNDENTLTPVTEIKEEYLTPQIPERQPGESITMSFVDAIKKVTEGSQVTRVSWAGTDYCLLKDGWLQIYTNGNFHTWLISDGDIEGQDWIILNKAN